MQYHKLFEGLAFVIDPLRNLLILVLFKELLDEQRGSNADASIL